MRGVSTCAAPCLGQDPQPPLQPYIIRSPNSAIVTNMRVPKHPPAQLSAKPVPGGPAPSMQATLVRSCLELVKWVSRTEPCIRCGWAMPKHTSDLRGSY